MNKTALLAIMLAAFPIATATVAYAENEHGMVKNETAAAPMEMKDGSWAKVDTAGKVWVSKDAGKTWMAAPDGTWEMKDGSKVMTKGGMKTM